MRKVRYYFFGQNPGPDLNHFGMSGPFVPLFSWLLKTSDRYPDFFNAVRIADLHPNSGGTPGSGCRSPGIRDFVIEAFGKRENHTYRISAMTTKTAQIQREITVPLNGLELRGILTIPTYARGIVIFSHGHGSSRLSPRNTYVAQTLQNGGMATLLIDLLTEEEDQNSGFRFDIELITERLLLITRWVRSHRETSSLEIAYFGASTGAAAALKAASRENIAAVVSRGGRPDLALNDLKGVTAPTLLIVGSNDERVLDWNYEALQKLRCEKQLKLVPGASHLFQEPGKLESVASLAADWFKKWF